MSNSLGFLQDAEDALLEANGADTHDPKCWGLFILICLNSTPSRTKEAKDALEQALALGLSNVDILWEMGEQFDAIDCYDESERIWTKGYEVAKDYEKRAEFNLMLGKTLERKNEFVRSLDVFEETLKFVKDMASDDKSLMERCDNEVKRSRGLGNIA